MSILRFLLPLVAVLTLLGFTDSQVGAQSDELIPFHIPGDDSSETITSFASRLGGDIESSGFVSIKDGKFSLAGKNQRF